MVMAAMQQQSNGPAFSIRPSPEAYAGFHFGRGWMASAGARTYNGGLGASCASSEVQGQSPWWGLGGQSPPEAESYLL